MDNAEFQQSVRFGRTRIQWIIGDAVDQPVEAIVYPANSRGVMGTGRIGSVRAGAGSAVEREAMAGSPFELGTAFVTSAGLLEDRGVKCLIHAVVARRLGDAPDPGDVRRALTAALKSADERRIRSVAIPVIGGGAETPAEERARAIETMIDEIVAFLRRAPARIESITIASRFEDDASLIQQAVERARARLWTPST